MKKSVSHEIIMAQPGHSQATDTHTRERREQQDNLINSFIERHAGDRCE